MEAITLPIYNTEGKEVDSVKLNTTVFDGTVNSAAIYQAVNAYRANQRVGLAATKTRGEVSGGGKKPWRQKGTGRARVGSNRSPLWRHGGVVFGPHPRDYSYVLPQKIKNLALKSSLNAKVKENNLIVVDDLKLAAPKTKEANKVFINLKVLDKKTKKGNYVLLLLEKQDKDLKMALDNLGFLNVNLAKDTHVYEVMSHKKLIITKEGLTTLTSRLKNG
ncbi:MAG: 50S ribosomal protein L4 [Candidatus Omnitrophica bacterium]|nr:50S ribosomal protein L4 [Candidatus Omnitrophota bacterium]MBU1869208.1 50S ribosomal protein L4 [Candidatus Omnitrophota bacterium]